jgi:MFS family permease
LLGYNENFWAIITISFGISVWLAMMRPIISGLISDYTHPKDGWTVTGAWEFIWRSGDICGALIFGILSLIVGLQFSFVIVGIIIFLISSYQLFRKFVTAKRS